LGRLRGLHRVAAADWQPLVNTPYDASCGATTVHVTYPVSKEFFKQTTLADGTIRFDFTGSLKITYSTDAGKSVTVNASGPGYELDYTNGEFEDFLTGLNAFTFSAVHQAQLGVPTQILVSAGPVDIYHHNDGSESATWATSSKTSAQSSAPPKPSLQANRDKPTSLEGPPRRAFPLPGPEPRPAPVERTQRLILKRVLKSGFR
jgi:hypothetical protein